MDRFVVAGVQRAPEICFPFSEGVNMSRSRNTTSGVLHCFLLAVVVVGYANLANPFALAGSGYKICSLAANPCQTCASTNNVSQCLPPPQLPVGLLHLNAGDLLPGGPIHLPEHRRIRLRHTANTQGPVHDCFGHTTHVQLQVQVNRRPEGFRRIEPP